MNFRIFSRPELLQEFFSIRKYILSFFLLIENYYSFASAEAILATFSFYDSKRSIGFMVFSCFSSCFSRPFDLGHFHWRRFIGGREFVSHFIQTSFTLLEKHFKFKAISSKNQRTKRKDRAMKWIRYLWTIKTTRQQYSTSSRFRGYARPCFYCFYYFSSFWPWAFSLEALHWRAWFEIKIIASKIFAIERLELSTLAMLTRRSNRLSYFDLFLAIDCSYSKQSFSNSYWIALRKTSHYYRQTVFTGAML